MSKTQQIVAGMARSLWIQALGLMDHDAGGGRWADAYDDVVYDNGPVPKEALQPAMELANLYELANGKTIVAMYDADPTGWEDEVLQLSPVEYGAALASNALRTASPKISVAPVRFEISFDGETLVWSGDIEPITSNPAPQYRVGDRVRVDDSKEGGGIWHGTVVTVEEDGWTRVEGDGKSGWRVPSELRRVNNPARGPTRAGERSRHRATLRGLERTTAVIPARSRAEQEAAELRERERRRSRKR